MTNRAEANGFKTHYLMEYRVNFIAHEPGVGHLAGRHFASGGAGFVVAEQTMAINRLLKRRSRTRVRVVCPRPPRWSHAPRHLPASLFPPCVGTLDEQAEQLASDPAWLEQFDALLPHGVLIAHHLPAALVAARLGRPFICQLHSLWPTVVDCIGAVGNQERRVACAEIQRAASAILVPTAVEKRLLVAAAADPNDAARLRRIVRVVPIGLNPRLERIAAHRNRIALRDRWRRRLVPAADHQSVVFYQVGRFVRYKNQLALLRSFVRVAGSLPNAHLLLVGPWTDHAYVEEIRGMLRSAPAAIRSRIVLRGAEPIEAAHLAGDVLVHASTLESWGKVFDEACLFARPTILHPFPTVAERSGFVRRCLPSGRATLEQFMPPARSDMWQPAYDASRPHSLLIDAENGSSIEAALIRAASDQHWRRACGVLNRELVRNRRWTEIAPELIAIWNRAEQESSGRVAFPSSATSKKATGRRRRQAPVRSHDLYALSAQDSPS